MPVLRRSEFRIFLFVAIGLVAVGVVAALAFARGKPIGTGVVVIDTNLGYQGGAAAGSGMVLTSSGTVLTNNHVIAGATTVKVVVPNTGHSYLAHVVGYDKTADVAVLRLQGASNLKTISVRSSSAAVGQFVRAVGNAGGTGNLTSARGTVTGLDRSIVASDEQGNSEQLTGLIETNAGVQPGDSGGPLLDNSGRVVGMDTAASGNSSYASESSDAYAIPIGTALTIAKQIVAGKASAAVHVGATAFLGVEVQAANSDPYGVSGYAGTAGALIAGVVPSGPAASAGLQAGDVITAIDGHAVASATQVSPLILGKKPGTKITVAYVDQDGNGYTTTVKLGTGPAQ
jgi:S1-C subfamily serine protease